MSLGCMSEQIPYVTVKLSYGGRYRQHGDSPQRNVWIVFMLDNITNPADLQIPPQKVWRFDK